MEKRIVFARRASRVRYKVKSKAIGRLRLSFFKSCKHISVQLIDDIAARTLISASTVEKEFLDLASSSNIGYNKSNKAAANLLAKFFCDRVSSSGISLDRGIVFDRGPYLYTGVVKEFADSVRQHGIVF